MNLNIDTGALKQVAIEAGKAGLPFLEQALSAALIPVAGPFGLLVAPALNMLFPAINDALGLAADTPPDQTAAKIASDPDAARAALDTLNAQQQFALAQQQQADQTQLAAQAQQTALVALDSASQRWWINGWRPAAAWVCVGALALDAVAIPSASWVAALYGHTLPPPPSTTDLFALLAALLGIGVMRSADKVTVASAVKAIVAPKVAAPAKR